MRKRKDGRNITVITTQTLLSLSYSHTDMAAKTEYSPPHYLGDYGHCSVTSDWCVDVFCLQFFVLSTKASTITAVLNSVIRQSVAS